MILWRIVRSRSRAACIRQKAGSRTPFPERPGTEDRQNLRAPSRSKGRPRAGNRGGAPIPRSDSAAGPSPEDRKGTPSRSARGPFRKRAGQPAAYPRARPRRKEVQGYAIPRDAGRLPDGRNSIRAGIRSTPEQRRGRRPLLGRFVIPICEISCHFR